MSIAGTVARWRQLYGARRATFAGSVETSISSIRKRWQTPSRRNSPMSAKASTLKSSIENFMRRQGIEAEMEQNLVEEAIHLHLLSAMSEAGILRHAVFQGGTALRLCYGGERYSEDLDFVCGKSGSYFTDVEFKELIEAALETTKKTLNRDFGIAADRISLKKT